ncbi:hypothetical protein AB0892_20345 [Streptomyces sp. NPDC005409]|uniref:hypothetical protein n=1 Tax=Streptomyces sp. NPDC005409 TaxID=3155342 RepID=UPI0034525E00
MLGGITITDFLAKAAPDAPPWQSDGTHHVTVHADTLRSVVRAVAQDPASYAKLRMAETRTTAHRLAAVPASAAGYSLSVPPTEGARALGVLDGIADAVTNGMDATEAQAWRTDVVRGLVHEHTESAPKGSPDPQAADLVAAWLRTLQEVPEEQRFDRMRSQGTDMARTWAEGRKMDEQTQQGLLAEVQRSALSAYREVKL